MIDAIIIVLLIATIAHGIILRARMAKFFAVIRELQPVIEQFSNAVDRTESSVKTLVESSSNISSGKTVPAAPASDPVSTFFRMARLGGRR